MWQVHCGIRGISLNANFIKENQMPYEFNENQFKVNLNRQSTVTCRQQMQIIVWWQSIKFFQTSFAAWKARKRKGRSVQFSVVVAVAVVVVVVVVLVVVLLVVVVLLLLLVVLVVVCVCVCVGGGGGGGGGLQNDFKLTFFLCYCNQNKKIRVFLYITLIIRRA